MSDSAGVRTQDPLRFGRGTYTKKRSLMRTLLIISLVIRLGFEPSTHCVLVGAYIQKKASSKNEDACLLSDSAGVRTQYPLRFGRGTYTKKASSKNEDACLLSDSAGVRTQDPQLRRLLL